MKHDLKVIIVLPAYNAEHTIVKTFNSIPIKYRKNVILVDDASSDKTVKVANKLGIQTFIHRTNTGYGGNQKTCYTEALKLKADIIVMVHPDYQYPPELIEPMVNLLETPFYDCILGSRILCGGAIKGQMPLYKYISNRFLTAVENILTGAKLSEYHSGLRAYRAEVIKNIDFMNNSDDFIFDNQILLQMMAHNYRFGEVSTPCNYFKEASSINFIRSLRYGLSCLFWGFIYYLGRIEIYKYPLFYSK
jgi:glycosyltransferase involved in cell wall biosynthesis